MQLPFEDNAYCLAHSNVTSESIKAAGNPSTTHATDSDPHMCKTQSCNYLLVINANIYARVADMQADVQLAANNQRTLYFYVIDLGLTPLRAFDNTSLQATCCY